MSPAMAHGIAHPHPYMHMTMNNQMHNAMNRRALQTTPYTEAIHGNHQTTSDTTWILLAGLFCFFLQGGFALLEAGAVRAKNAKNIALKNLMDACIGGVVYWFFGYAFAYASPGTGDGNPFIGGFDFPTNTSTFDAGQYYMLNGHYVDSATETDPKGLGYGEMYGFFFQYVFAATTATIVSGAVAERIKFSAYIIYSILLTGIIYPICSHWIWCGDGYLYKWGVIDYAGGGAVHALSGVAAWMGAAALGPRIGRYVDGKPVEIPPHNASMMALGTFVLWLGFIPFNAGSGVSILDANGMSGQTSRIAVMTTLGGCAGGCVSLAYGYLKLGYGSLEYSINGVLAGMVSVCSPCACVEIWAQFWIISPLGTMSFWGFQKMNEKVGVDDPLGASSLHFGPGIVGLLAIGFFATDSLTGFAYGYTYGVYHQQNATDPDNFKNYVGVFYGGNGYQLGIQLMAGTCYTVYGLITCGLMFFGLKACKQLRVSEEDEMKGLDVTHHGGPAYIMVELDEPKKAAL